MSQQLFLTDSSAGLFEFALSRASAALSLNFSGAIDLGRQRTVVSARRHGATIRDLATELQVSLKTVRRDLDTLTQTGFPIEGRIEDFGRQC